jgi:hypothetical protein
MKKIIYLIIAICFAGFVANGQYSCTSPKKLSPGGNGNYDSIPPTGTIGAAGPDYGCLSVTGRQLWYYVPVCNQNWLYGLDLFFGNSGGLDTIGAILYGPFSQSVTNCSDFNSSKILSCSQLVNNISNMNFTFNDTLYSGYYYYMLLTFSDAIYGNANFSFFPSGYFTTNCFECNNQVSVIDKNNICMVTVDTAINKCVLTWQEFPDVNLAGYNIYRESTLTGIYDSIATVPVGSISTYTDMGSSPSQHNYTYGVRGVDSCGNTYAQNNLSYLQSYVFLTSIHLISFAGGNNEANLIWNNVYTNNDFIPQYYIYRNNNGSGWQVIDSIGITLSTITYTDIFAPAGTNHYTVELRKLAPCVPMRLTSTAYQSVFSNTSTTMVTGIEVNESSNNIVVYPNPFTDKLNIKEKGNDFYEMILFDLTSRKILNQSFTKSTSINAEQLAKGIYIYEMRNKNGVIKKGKVVKE